MHQGGPGLGVGAALLNLIYPRRCPVCGEPVPVRRPRLRRDGARPAGVREGKDASVSAGVREGLICPDCEGAFSVVEEPTCFKCGRGLSDPSRELCRQCEDMPKAFDRCFALFNYDETAASSVLRFKNGGRREYAEYYAARFTELRGEQLAGARPQVIVPVPLYAGKLRKRGYNQAAEFGRALSKRLGIPMRGDLLAKISPGEEQKSLSAASRARNVAETIRVSREAAGYRRVLLVDDVYTTGSTLSACARKLKKAGVDEVCCAVIAIANEE